MSAKKLFLSGMVIVAVVLHMAGCGDDEAVPPGDDPTASTLSVQAEGLSPAINATWTECPDDDFEEYRLYRDTESGIQQDPDNATLVTVVDSASDTTYRDSGLDYQTTYYYALRTTDTEALHAWSNEVSATTPDSGGCPNVYTCYQVQSQQDSSLYVGDTLSVTGIVTGSCDDYPNAGYTYALLGDASGGEWSGLLMFGNDLTELERGDSVTITGEIDEWYGATELKYPTDIVVHSSGHSLPPVSYLTTGEIATGNDPEKWESVLVGVQDVEVTAEPDQYGIWNVDDGSGDCRIDDWGTYSYSPGLGDQLSEIVGVLTYDWDEFKIQPRDDGDITP